MNKQLERLIDVLRLLADKVPRLTFTLDVDAVSLRVAGIREVTIHYQDGGTYRITSGTTAARWTSDALEAAHIAAPYLRP